MYVVMLASECAPVAKVGGLGDVVYGLSRELEQHQHAVEIILPRYAKLTEQHLEQLEIAYENLIVPWYDNAIRCTVWFSFMHGRRIFFIEPHSADNFFQRDACYGYADDHLRFAFFSKAALEFLLKSGKRPDVIHCHDWQTGLVGPLLYEIYQYHGLGQQRLCYTIHNFRHQGQTGLEVLAASGLNRPDYYLHPDRLQDHSNPQQLNLMKGGIVYANAVNTVSPRHAWEARNTEQGDGLGHTLYVHQNKFSGILNGLDDGIWNPKHDPLIAHHFSAHDLSGKAICKHSLQQQLGLDNNGQQPLFAYVGRLDQQKGLNQLWQMIHHARRYKAQFVLLGSSPEVHINQAFKDFQAQHADDRNLHIHIGFDETLAHQIYAGADYLVMPSEFEPCGLAQLIALRYGTLPIVRRVGGLADTVFDYQDTQHPAALRNGIAYQHNTHSEVAHALNRALALYQQPDDFRALQINGMRQDYSWKRAGADYIALYEQIRHRPAILERAYASV